MASVTQTLSHCWEDHIGSVSPLRVPWISSYRSWNQRWIRFPARGMSAWQCFPDPTSFEGKHTLQSQKVCSLEWLEISLVLWYWHFNFLIIFKETYVFTLHWVPQLICLTLFGTVTKIQILRKLDSRYLLEEGIFTQELTSSYQFNMHPKTILYLLWLCNYSILVSHMLQLFKLLRFVSTEKTFIFYIYKHLNSITL